MAHQALIALCEVVLSIAVEVAERCRQAVAAMLVRHAAERPQGILQALRQSHEAFATENDVSVREARERQPEVVEPMVQRDAADRDAEPAGVGEVREAETARLVLLSEDDVLLRSGQGAPGPHTPFQRAPDARADLGMAAPDLLENRNGADTGRRLQNRQDLGLPYLGQRIGPATAAGLALLRGQTRIVLDAKAGRRREAGLGGGNVSAVALSVTHVQPHLVVGDMEAGQITDPSKSETNQ